MRGLSLTLQKSENLRLVTSSPTKQRTKPQVDRRGSLKYNLIMTAVKMENHILRKSRRKLIVIATGLTLALTYGFLLATSHSDRPRQRAMRLHTRNLISTHTFSISTNVLASGQSQKPQVWR